MSTQPTYITPEVRSFIGREVELAAQEASRENITYFAQAIRHSPQVPTGQGSRPPDPLYADELYARSGPNGGQVAPPLYVQRFLHVPWAEEQTRPIDVPIPLSRSVNGGTEYELLAPVRPGDWVTVRIKIADIYEKQGRAGPLVFIVREAVLTNQLGQRVARVRQTTIKF